MLEQVAPPLEQQRLKDLAGHRCAFHPRRTQETDLPAHTSHTKHAITGAQCFQNGVSVSADSTAMDLVALGKQRPSNFDREFAPACNETNFFGRCGFERSAMARKRLLHDRVATFKQPWFLNPICLRPRQLAWQSLFPSDEVASASRAVWLDWPRSAFLLASVWLASQT